MSRTNYICFTINNYDENTILMLQDLVFTGLAAYIIIGCEVGEQGTNHIQGYVEFTNRLRFGQVHNVLPGAHVESRLGTALQAAEYCKKDGNWLEEGIMSSPRQGTRTDILVLKEYIDTGVGLKDIANEHFGSFIRYEKSIRSYRSLIAPGRDWVPEVYVLWGPTGTGKTRRVYDSADASDIYNHPGGLWYDGYDGQPVVLFDEFSGSYMSLPYLLKLLDRYPMTVPVKGGFANWIPRIIYITSNLDPLHWYTNAHTEHVQALFRRISHVEYVGPERNVSNALDSFIHE